MYINNFQRLSRISYKTIKRNSKQMFVCVMLKGVCDQSKQMFVCVMLKGVCDQMES